MLLKMKIILILILYFTEANNPSKLTSDQFFKYGEGMW